MYINCKPETKAQAIELHNAGKSVTAISKELNISESTLRNWFLQYSTPQSVTEAQISHEVSRLTTECMHLTNTIEIIRQTVLLFFNSHIPIFMLVTIPAYLRCYCFTNIKFCT